MIGNLNINSVANKLDELKILFQGKLDVSVVTETKLNSRFQNNQLIIDGFHQPYRLDKNKS